MNNVIELKSKRDELLDRHMDLTIDIAHMARHIVEFQIIISQMSVELDQIEAILDKEEIDNP